MKIKDITEWAKEFMLKDGSHAPTLFVETDAPQMVIAELAGMPGTPAARQPYFLAMGRKLAAEHPGVRVREVAFIAMSWASMQLPGQPAPKTLPSKDPNRMELLLIAHLTLDADGSMKEDGQMVEIIRDNKGKVRDLYHRPDTVESGLSPFLILFVLGFNYPQASDSQIMQLMQDMRGPK
jgi:hypothetical protein